MLPVDPYSSLCGWSNWYAPVGHSLGNSWRIGPDDTNWGGVLKNIDIMAPLWPYAGPGGWNDPCLLLGRDNRGNVAVTDQQGRAQFTMWAIISAPLLLSQNVRSLTPFQLETYLNTEVISISQDPLGRQGQRLTGGDLSGGAGNPPLTLQTCGTNSYQIWQWNVTAPLFLSNPSTSECANLDDCGNDLIAYPCVTSGGTCMGPNDYSNEEFYLNTDGTLRTKMNGNCVTHTGLGSSTFLSPCSSSSTQKWAYDSNIRHITSLGGTGCLTIGGTGPRTNIWGRPLEDGGWAIAFINADDAPFTMTCDENCLAVTGWEPAQELQVRDLWAHQELPTTTVQKGITVSNLAANGGVSLFKLTPLWK